MTVPADDELKDLKAAIRSAFPHFQSDEPITPEAIKEVGRDFTHMVMNWVPFQHRIEFVDAEGKFTGAIIYQMDEFDTECWVLED